MHGLSFFLRRVGRDDRKRPSIASIASDWRLATPFVLDPISLMGVYLFLIIGACLLEVNETYDFIQSFI